MIKIKNVTGFSTDQENALEELQGKRQHDRLARKALVDQARELRSAIKQIEEPPDCKFVMKALGVGSNRLRYYLQNVGPKVNFEEWEYGFKKEMAAQCVITPYGFRIACDRAYKLRDTDNYSPDKYRMWTSIMVHLARGGVTAESINDAIKELARDCAKGNKNFKSS